MMISNFTDPDKGKYKDLGIHHSLDMWHGAKNLAKKLAAVSAMSGSCYYIYTSSLNVFSQHFISWMINVFLPNTNGLEMYI